jgi:hypothetical protein
VKENMWGQIKDFLKASNPDVQNVIRGITRIEIAMKMLERSIETSVVAEVTELEVGFVQNLKKIVVAMRMFQEGAEVQKVLEETGLDVNALNQMKKDMDAGNGEKWLSWLS